MNIKIIIHYLALFLLSLNAFAIENKMAPSGQDSVLAAQVVSVAFNSQNRQSDPFDRSVDKRRSRAQASLDKQGELFIEICVYITIIMVYSLYWLTQPNEANKRH